jgi:guanine deaminase
MISGLKSIALFGAVLFSAYSQYDAIKTVKKFNLNKPQLESRVNETSPTDHEFMKRALELSQLAVKDNHGHPFGSVLVKDGKIIGEGWNRTKLLKDPSAHAEIEAIRDACKNLDNSDLSACTIYASAQPCPMCLSLINQIGIKRVYYCIPHDKIQKFDKDLSVGYIHEELPRAQTDRKILEVQILPEYADKYLESYMTQ